MSTLDFQVGDPDTTLGDVSMPVCGYGWTDGYPAQSWTCSRDQGHLGNHAAGTGQVIAAVAPRS